MRAYQDFVRSRTAVLVIAVLALLASAIFMFQGSSDRREGEAQRAAAWDASSRAEVIPSSPTPVQATDSAASHANRMDREKREELRRRLVEIYRQAAATEGGVAPVVGSAGAGFGAARPQLPDDAATWAQYIGDRIRSDFAPMAEGCYRDLLAQRPLAQGDVVVRFEILANESLGGIVSSVELANRSTLREQSFDTCLRESFVSLDFDQLRTPMQLTGASLPLHFADGRMTADYEMHPKDKR